MTAPSLNWKNLNQFMNMDHMFIMRLAALLFGGGIASCRTCHHPGRVVVPASGCRFHTSSSFFQRRDRKRKGRKSPALPSRYGRDNYQILLLVLQFPCLWRSRFRQDQIHRQTLMEQYIRSGFAGFIYDFKDFDYTRTAYNLIRKHGYPHEFYYVNFTDMNRTYRFNPLDRRNIKDRTMLMQLMEDVLGALMPPTSKQDEWYTGTWHPERRGVQALG